MSEHAPETPETPETPQTETPETPATPAGGWAGPSQDEWQKTTQSIDKLTQLVGELFEDPGEELEPPDPNSFDMTDPRQVAALMEMVVDSRMGQITPYVKTAAQDQGRRVMQETFATLKGEGEGKVGDFDENLAERLANFYFEQTGDPQGSLRAAAEEAARIRAEERAAGVKSVPRRRGPSDPDETGIGGGATPIRKYESYDDVVDAYSRDTEV
jgi:hypothetical protein